MVFAWMRWNLYLIYPRWWPQRLYGTNRSTAAVTNQHWPWPTNTENGAEQRYTTGLVASWVPAKRLTAPWVGVAIESGPRFAMGHSGSPVAADTVLSCGRHCPIWFTECSTYLAGVYARSVRMVCTVNRWSNSLLSSFEGILFNFCPFDIPPHFFFFAKLSQYSLLLFRFSSVIWSELCMGMWQIHHVYLFIYRKCNNTQIQFYASMRIFLLIRFYLFIGLFVCFFFFVCRTDFLFVCARLASEHLHCRVSVKLRIHRGTNIHGVTNAPQHKKKTYAVKKIIGWRRLVQVFSFGHTQSYRRSGWLLFIVQVPSCFLISLLSVFAWELCVAATLFSPFYLLYSMRKSATFAATATTATNSRQHHIKLNITEWCCRFALSQGNTNFFFFCSSWDRIRYLTLHRSFDANGRASITKDIFNGYSNII